MFIFVCVKLDFLCKWKCFSCTYLLEILFPKKPLSDNFNIFFKDLWVDALRIVLTTNGQQRANKMSKTKINKVLNLALGTNKQAGTCIFQLTLFQTTHFRLFRNENSGKFSKRVQNTVGKGEIARDAQFLLFPLCFKRFVLQTHKNQGLFGKGLTLY